MHCRWGSGRGGTGTGHSGRGSGWVGTGQSGRGDPKHDGWDLGMVSGETLGIPSIFGGSHHPIHSPQCVTLPLLHSLIHPACCPSPLPPHTVFAGTSLGLPRPLGLPPPHHAAVLTVQLGVPPHPPPGVQPLLHLELTLSTPRNLSESRRCGS